MKVSPSILTSVASIIIILVCLDKNLNLVRIIMHDVMACMKKSLKSIDIKPEIGMYEEYGRLALSIKAS